MSSRTSGHYRDSVTNSLLRQLAEEERELQQADERGQKLKDIRDRLQKRMEIFRQALVFLEEDSPAHELDELLEDDEPR